eukprot:Hpha_TRINITY_DN15590_c3_g6::TRINITY_DN15590_c3_g6_i1::g.106326::m.106326
MRGLDCLVREMDSKEQARIKRIVFPFTVFAAMVSVMLMVVTIQSTHQALGVIGIGLVLAGLTIFIVGIPFNAAPAGSLLDALLVITFLGICIEDLARATRSYSFRSWTVLILHLDIALVFNRDHLTRYMIAFLLIYTAAQSAEAYERFGLYEAGYWGSAGIEINECNCASPPCVSSLSSAIFSWIGICAVMLGDFYFTREFARGMRLQLCRVEASVEVAREIATALAQYDVDTAEEAVSKGKHLPAALAESFNILISNLRCYSPYLPHNCLMHQNSSPLKDAQPPGGDSGDSHGDSSGSSEMRRVSEHVPLLGGEPRTAPRKTRASVACSNVLGYLQGYVWLGEERHLSWFASDVESWCYLVHGSCGIVDLIAGDRRYASFNAAR